MRAVIALAVLGLHAGVVSAAPGPKPGLNWVRLKGAESCIAAGELARGVERRIGRAAFVNAREATMFIDGHVRRSGDWWDVTLELADPDGAVLGRRELRFRGAECHVIDQPVTLIIAITLYSGADLTRTGITLDPAVRANLDALFEGEPSELDPTSLPAKTSASDESGALDPRGAEAEPEPSPPARPAAPDATTTPTLAVDIVGAGMIGQLPEFAWGLTVHALWQSAWPWPLEFAFVGSLPQTAVMTQDFPWSDGVDGETRFQFLAGSVSACPLNLGSRSTLSLCAGAEIGRVRAEPNFSGLENSPASNDLWVALSSAAALRVRVSGGMFLRATAQLGVALTRWSYRVFTGTSRPDVFTTPPVNARFETGFGWQF